jgi:hypothetical protein
MRKWKVLLPIVAVAASVFVGPAVDANASTVFCTGPFSGTVNSSVIVPSGADCFMEGATIKGGVTVFPGAALETCFTTIQGSLNSTQDYLNIAQTTDIYGNVVLNRPGLVMTGIGTCSSVGPGEYASVLCPEFIGGNLTVMNAPANSQEVEVGGCNTIVLARPQAPVSLTSMQINGNVSIFGNHELVTVEGAYIGGNLACFNNHPQAEQGGNVVKGAIVGCAPLL